LRICSPLLSCLRLANGTIPNRRLLAAATLEATIQRGPAEFRVQTAPFPGGQFPEFPSGKSRLICRQGCREGEFGQILDFVKAARFPEAPLAWASLAWISRRRAKGLAEVSVSRSKRASPRCAGAKRFSDRQHELQPSSGSANGSRQVSAESVESSFIGLVKKAAGVLAVGAVGICFQNISQCWAAQAGHFEGSASL